MILKTITLMLSILLAVGMATSHADHLVASGERSGFARDRDRDRDHDHGGDEAQRLMPLDRAVSMVQSRFNATAVKTDMVNDSGQVLYRIRLLSADRSRVWTVTVDARSGQVY